VAFLALLVLVTAGRPAVATPSVAPSFFLASSAPVPPVPTLSLNTGVAPSAICALESTSCPAAAGMARVQLSASAQGGPVASWPAVQVAFVIETTSYDGVLGTDRSDDLDVCAAQSPTSPACEESNGVPFFVANAQAIANGIQEANPHSAVSFALVDYYDARGEPWDDTDGPEYNVDIGQFVPAGQFGGLVISTFQQSVMNGLWYSWDQDLDNNFLHPSTNNFLDSSSITALYGAIVGSQLNWANAAHHVIVWMGSSAPRDPSYSENYCVSPSQWNIWGPPATCLSQSCEPSYIFQSGSSPECEGWARSQDGNPKDSIAALAHNAPACTGSIGGVCTVDTIDLWTTTTDPYSQGWPAASQYTKIGGGPGGYAVQTNVAHVLDAGCDLAIATGGSWSGPAFASCPNGVPGNLQYSPFGRSIDTPNTQNPTLFNAFRSIGFGPVYGTQVASGTDQPIFQYVPIGNIAVAPAPEWSAVCSTPAGFLRTCQQTPFTLHHNGVTYFGWNWSTVPSENAIYVGDSWSVSFNVIATGPPYSLVPVDACTTLTCRAAGSGALGGVYTLASYLTGTNTSVVTQSFPLAEVLVQAVVGTGGPPATPPAPPPPPPGFPVVVNLPTPIATPVPITAQLGVGTISLQSAAAGFLGAGFMRVGLKNRPIAMAVAAKSGAAPSRFQRGPEGDPRLGRME
jgi:hypothetical protein